MKNIFLISITIWILGISGCKKDDTNNILKAPTLSTSVINNITQTSAASGGSISSDGGDSVTERGVCWSTHTNPTVTDSKTSDGTGTGNFSSTITGLTNNTTYYVRAYAKNSIGTAYGNEASFTTSTPAFIIGQSYGGGKIFYIDGTGNHGLIVSSVDQGFTGTTTSVPGLISSTLAPNTLIQWGCIYTTIVGADGTAIGTGNQNTIDIEAGCTTSGTAADICANLVLNSYSDWFLPSKDEIYQLYLQRASIGGLSGTYWSSTEYNYEQAWFQGFDAANGQINWYKDEPMHVRAVRTF